MSSEKSILKALPLFLVLFIDGMGLAILFPVLTGIIVNPHSTFLAASISQGSRSLLFGFIIGIYMICWFFGAAVLGDLSDSIGRKKALVICLLGAFGGYFLSAIAIIVKSVGLLILGRVIAGFTAGSQPIAQAAIVDVSTPETKARNIGFILLSVSLGFVLGPVIGGLLSDSNLVGWFDFSTPMYFSALISFLNAILLMVTFKETFKKTGKIKIKLHHAIMIFVEAFRHKKIRWLSLVMLVMIFGWSNYFTFISMYLVDVFKYDTLEISLFLAVLGLGFAVGCGYLVNFCAKHFSLKKSIIINIVITAICIIIMLSFLHNPIAAWGTVFFIAASQAVSYSLLLAAFSNEVDENEQGWVMGVTGSIMALCFGITSFSIGYFARISVELPMILSIFGLLVSAFLMSFFRSPSSRA